MSATTEAATLVVHRHPPVSLNAVLGMNRWKRAEHNRLWQSEAFSAWLNAGQPEFERCIMTVTFYARGDRQIQDDENLYGACKPITDGLKRRAFPDDSRDVLDLRVQTRVSNDDPRVEIELREWIA